ncbi:hypothetical protein CFBP5473_23985 (plasmid) [Agrobacterium larrymoorei]|uniref:homoserine dehydrogenase n=1 Tax=Agrobacterium larrymoorei TaxID=160699 RepID=A0A4D7DVC6_9HYPH|nr:hypothetical protein CFBP5473_23985 [Agrobacterium larrymoorei]
MEYRVVLIGFGGVNRALAELIATRNKTWAKSLGFRLKIVAVTDLKLGSLVSDAGIDARALVDTSVEQGGFSRLPGGRSVAENEAVIRKVQADIVVEATFTNPGDGEPAISHCRWALSSVRRVVTTNKGPVALAAVELKALAAQNHVRFEYEGSVMSGTPIMRMAKETLGGCDILGFEGILNGTSNFILSRMETGCDFLEALHQAQELGYAEADPTADIEGHDVRLKATILANELLGGNVNQMTSPAEAFRYFGGRCRRCKTQWEALEVDRFGNAPRRWDDRCRGHAPSPSARSSACGHRRGHQCPVTQHASARGCHDIRHGAGRVETTASMQCLLADTNMEPWVGRASVLPTRDMTQPKVVCINGR